MGKKGQTEKYLVEELRCMRLKYRGLLRRYCEMGSDKIKILYDREEVLSKYSVEDWEMFEYQFDLLFPHFVKRLSLEFPKMTVFEQRCCCLFLLNIKTGRIANVLCLASNTVSKYRKAICCKYFDTDDVETLEDRLHKLI